MKHFTKKAGLLLSLTLGGSMLSSMTALAIPTEKSSTKLHAEMTSLSDMRDITVTGTVISGEDGLTLPGVSILIKGTTRGVTTDMDGKFSIDIPDEGATLVFSFIGFAQQEVEVYTAKDLSITLEPEMTSMTEVVVVGYGTMRKGDVTSSIGGVKEEDFVKGAVRDAAQLVQGKVAGLRVTTPSGDPGASTQINLRGINSINGTSNPLILIDGVPGDLNTVPPEDIESVDVLKDGSAAAIYGTRATGGVILITTKKNSGGNRNSINYNTYVSLQTIARKPELLTGDDYRRLIDEEGIAYTDYGGNTDWVDEMTRNPISQNHNLSFSGGDRKTNFTASLNYRNWQGIFLRSNQERFNIRADLNHSMFDDKLRANFQIINRVFTREEGGADGYAYRQAIIRNPTDQVRTEDGGWQERDGYFYENPISRIYEADSESKFKEMRVNGSLNYNPIDNLDIKLMVSNVQNSNLTGYATSFQHTNTRLNNQNGTASRSTSAYNENLLEFTTNYNKAVGDHYFTLLGGYSWQDATYEDFNASNWDFPTDLYKWNNLGAGGALQAGQAGMGSSKNKWQLAGFFGRATYSYHEKYLFMASVRREGS